MKVRKAIIPAAGYGTRFLPVTKAMPKEMLNIVDKPAIQYIVEEAVAAGIEEILIITTRNKASIENHFDSTPELDHMLEIKGKDQLLKLSQSVTDLAEIFFKRQKEMKGLGHAVLQAKAFVGDEPFAVLLGDDIVYHDKPCLKQLIEVFEEKNGSVLGVQSVRKEDVSKYGIVDGEKLNDRTYTVKGMIEKPSVEEAPTNVAILGRYVLTASIFDILETTEPGKGGEIQLTDGLIELAKKEAMYAYDFEGIRYDTGDKFGYLKATVEYALRHEGVKDQFKDYMKNLSDTL